MRFSKTTVWIITALVLIFYILNGLIMIETTGHPIGLCDFDFHLDKINGAPTQYTKDCYDNDPTTTTPKQFEVGFPSYPSLSHSVLKWVGVRTQIELFLVMLLIVVVIPVWLFVENVNPIAGFIFLCFSLIHLEILQATIPQAIVVALFLVYLFKFRKNYYVLTIFALLSIGLHREGVFFFFIVAMLEFVDTHFSKFLKERIVLFSAPFVPKLTLKSIETIPETFLFSVPFWLIWITRKSFINSIFKMGLLTVSLIGVFTFSFRIAWIAQVLLTVELAKEIHEGNIKHEKLLIASMVLFLAIELAYFATTNYAFFFK